MRGFEDRGRLLTPGESVIAAEPMALQPALVTTWASVGPSGRIQDLGSKECSHLRRRQGVQSVPVRIGGEVQGTDHHVGRPGNPALRVSTGSALSGPQVSQVALPSGEKPMPHSLVVPDPG